MSTYPTHYDDMSDYLVHFTKSTPTRSDYENMMSIYGERTLRPGRAFGIARESAPDPVSQLATCFSEVPLHLLNRFVSRRGRYGIGFRREHMRSRGVAPVWYLEKDSPALLAVQALIAKAWSSRTPAADAVWRIAPLIDAPGEYPTGRFRFEWEREWRHIGPFQFSENDVAFLIIPEELHVAARGFFNTAYQENTGPAYFCPYIDAAWGKDRIAAALGIAGLPSWPE